MKIKTILFSIIASIAFALNSSAAYEGYFKADTILGDSTRAAWAEHTAILAYSHEVNAVRDTSGLPTGKRQHAPFKILKEVSGNSPQFMQKLVANETIETAVLKLIRINLNGEEFVFYTYNFTGVRILSIRNWIPNSPGAATSASTPELEEIVFTYDTIEWTATTTKITTTDSTRR